MKSFFKYFIVIVAYILLGTVFWGDQQILLPVFASVYILINLYLMDINKKLGINFVQISGVMMTSFLFGLVFLNDVDKILVVEYIGLMLVSSSLVYLLKKNFKFLPA